MIPSVNSLCSGSISLLFGTAGATQTTQTDSAVGKLLGQATGHTDDVFKAGSAVGKIIEIVAGMNGGDAKSSASMFTVDGAVRTEGSEGEYSLTKTGTGKAGSKSQYADRAMVSLQEKAAGSGPQADWARTYLDAMSNGTVIDYDMSAMGVTSTMTEKQTFNADGNMEGSSTRPRTH